MKGNRKNFSKITSKQRKLTPKCLKAERIGARSPALTFVRYPESLRIGIHTSTAGSLERAAIKAHELGANTFQIFSGSPRMWQARLPDPEQIKRLQDCRAQHDLTPLVIHGSYLINLGAPPSILRQKSIEAFSGELERAILIGAEYLVLHPGSYKGLTVEEGMANVAVGLAQAWHAVDARLKSRHGLTVLLENTAGAGSQLGGNFAELAAIRERAAPHLDIPLGYCLDTCHCFVSGFDLSAPSGFQYLLASAADLLGLGNIPVFNFAFKFCLSFHVTHWLLCYKFFSHLVLVLAI